VRQDMRRHWIYFICMLFTVIAVWGYSRKITLQWDNVPPAPSVMSASAMTLGDTQMSYRFLGLLLQIYGNTGGRYTAMKNYDYNALKQWFDVLHEMDSRSEYLPFLVSYYFTAGQQTPDQLRIAVQFLEKAGVGTGDMQWRWLAQAVFLARYRLNDIQYALDLSHKLENHADPAVGLWARNLPSIIMGNMGEKDAALSLSLALLKEYGATMDHREVYYLKTYICNQLLEPEKRGLFALCHDIDPSE